MLNMPLEHVTSRPACLMATLLQPNQMPMHLQEQWMVSGHQMFLIFIYVVGWMAQTKDDWQQAFVRINADRSSIRYPAFRYSPYTLARIERSSDINRYILGCPVVDHLAIITRMDNIGKLYGQRLTYLHNLQRVYCMQNCIKPQSRKKYRRNSDFYYSWSTCHSTWRRVQWSIGTAHARISHEKSLCINDDKYV